MLYFAALIKHILEIQMSRLTDSLQEKPASTAELAGKFAISALVCGLMSGAN